MALDPETIAKQQALLDGNRRRLAHLIRQLDTFGAHTPHHIVADVEQAQANISAIKATLRDAGVAIDGEPNDDIDARQVLQRERQARLHALLADHSDFMRDRLASFVGRARELEEIRTRIAALLPTGGYLTITGQAGQGKSSVIAKLVAEYGPENVAHHFIPFNPGPDHQVGLMRNLLARLILKYDLPEFYAASESRPALRDYFPRALAELVAKGGQEVIFIDGLDQLEEEQSGVRDLSFLPPNPPAGVVFVLGTRPNDTLKPLELLKPHREYWLPDMSRADFDLVLAHRDITLGAGLAERFYAAMHANALYLDLAAKELSEDEAAAPEAIIARVADNPDNLFTFAIDRLKRRTAEWYDIIRPTLGLLLAARAPLALRSIRDLLGANNDALRDGLRRLGGLLAQDGAGRYSIYHLKLYEYLRQDEACPNKDYLFAADEVMGWHRRLAGWCEGSVGGLPAIWQDTHDSAEEARRAYAREHYISHLFHAEEWQRLWAVLDAGDYGRPKIRYDPSTRAYLQDIDLGRQAAGRVEWEFTEALVLLPKLWHYSLLHCILASQVDSYPDSVFEAMALLGREQEAIRLAELITKIDKKAGVLIRIGSQLAKQAGRKQEGLQVLLRAGNVALTIKQSDTRTWVLRDVALALAQAGESEETLVIVQTIEESDERAGALWDVAVALAQAGKGKEARTIVSAIEESDERAWVLRDVEMVLAQMKKRKHVQTVTHTIGEDQRAQALRALEAAQAVKEAYVRAMALGTEAATLAQIGESEQGYVLLAEALAVARLIKKDDARSQALRGVAVALAQIGEDAKALTVVRLIMKDDDRSQALRGVAVALAQIGEDAKALTVVRLIMKDDDRAVALWEVAVALVHAGQEVQGAVLLAEAIARVGAINEDFARTRALHTVTVALSEVVVALAQAGERVTGYTLLEKTLVLARKLGKTVGRVEVLCRVMLGLVQIGESKRGYSLLREALVVVSAIEMSDQQVQALKELRAVARVLVQAGKSPGAQGAIYTMMGDKWASLLHKEAVALARAGKGVEALVVVSTIEKIYERAKALREVTMVLLHTSMSTQGYTLVAEITAAARTIEDTDRQANMLRAIAAAIGHEGLTDQLLHLVQQSWREATTRDHLLQLLPMASGLIKLKPEIGVAFAESFAWVDDFLKG